MKCRLNSLGQLGKSLYEQAKDTSGPIDEEEAPSVYQLFTQREKGKVDWTPEELSAELAGQV